MNDDAPNYGAPPPLHEQLYEAYRAQMEVCGVTLPSWQEASFTADTRPPALGIGPWIAVEQRATRYFNEQFSGRVTVGAVVRLRGGGPMMTVTDADLREATVEWHSDSGEPQKATYPILALHVESTLKPRPATAPTVPAIGII